MNRAIIEFGSNIEPEANIARAKELLGKAFRIVRESGLLTTRPYGAADQDDYMNCAVMVETDMAVDEMKLTLGGIEDGLGRNRKAGKFAPRTIDLDIVVWNGKVVHKDFYDREYVRINVGEIMPDLTP